MLEQFPPLPPQKPHHVPRENRKGQRLKTSSKSIGKLVRVRLCSSESIASKAPDGSQAKVAMRDRRAQPRNRGRRARLYRDWHEHDVEIGNVTDKLNHDRLIATHEFAQFRLRTAPIFDHVHLSPVVQNRTKLHYRVRFGHHDMRGGSLETTSQRKSLPTIPRQDRRKHTRRLRGHQPDDRVVCPAKFEGAAALEVFTLEEDPRTG